MMKLIRATISNLATFMLSLVLAVIIWFNAIQAEDPLRNQFLQIPIEFIRQPGDSILVMPTSTQQFVQIVFQGPSSVVDPISVQDFTAVVDLSQAVFGEEVLVPVALTTKAPNIEILSQSVEQITVHLEQLVTRNIPIGLDLRGSTAIGYTQGEPLLDPQYITVAGTASQVEPLDIARVTIFLNNERETVRRTPQPIFYNKQGRVASVSGLELSAEQVEVTIPINESAGFAEKFINVDLKGEPAPGYRVVNVEIDPPSVLLQGRATQLNLLTWVQTEPIDITGLTESFRPQIALALPIGVTPAEVEEIFVTIAIEPFRTTSIFNRVPQIQGLAAGLEATLSPETVRVVIFGPLPVLNTLLEDEISVVIDLFGLSAGKYNVEPDIDFPEQRGIELRSVQPTQVTVQITAKVAPTNEITSTVPATTTSARPLPTPPPHTTSINIGGQPMTAVAIPHPILPLILNPQRQLFL